MVDSTVNTTIVDSPTDFLSSFCIPIGFLYKLYNLLSLFLFTYLFIFYFLFIYLFCISSLKSVVKDQFKEDFEKLFKNLLTEKKVTQNHSFIKLSQEFII